MAIQPQQLDPLPIPDAPQPGQNPPVPPAAQPQAGMGWVSKSGAGAYLASNILTGWMAGRNFAQQRKLDKARMDVVGAKTAKQVADQNYMNLIDQGAPDEKANPEEKKAYQDKLNAAVIAVNAAKEHELNVSERYAFPDDGGQKKSKGKKIESGLHNAFMGQDPELFAKSSLELLRNTPDPVFSYGQDQEKKNRLALEKKQLEEADLMNQQRRDEAASRADKDALLKQFKTGTPAEQAQARLELKNKYGMDVETAQQMEASDKKAELADKLATDALEAHRILDMPGKTSSDLTVNQRAAANIALGPYDAYLNYNRGLVGTKYKNNAEADIAANKMFLRDQYAAQAIAGRSAFDREMQDIRTAEYRILDVELRDPATAGKYGLKVPLAKGQPIPQNILEREVLKRIKPSATDKTDARLNVNRAISVSIKNMLERSDLKPDDRKFIEDNFIRKDDDTGLYVINPEAAAKGETWKMFGKNQPTLGGVAPEEYERRHQQFYADLARIMAKTNPGASKDRIMEGLQSADPSGYFVDSMPDSTPESNALAPPPQPGEQKEQPLGAGAATGNYTVAIPGQGTKEMELTEDEVNYIQQTYPSAVVQFVPSQRMPHGH
jgi:hypothetical protein